MFHFLLRQFTSTPAFFVAALFVAASVVANRAVPARVAEGSEAVKLVASDASPDDRFGGSVAVDGTTAIIGAIGDDDACGGVPTCDSGAAYLFDTNSGQQLFKLTADDAAPLDSFGISVAVDGNLAIVGALNDSDAGAVAGSAYVFDTTTGRQLNKLSADDAAPLDFFGRSVDVDRNLAVVGAFLDEDAGIESGSAYVFDLTTGQPQWKLRAEDGARGDWFGRSVAVNNNTIIVGAPEPGSPFIPAGTGSAYVFDAVTGQQRWKWVGDHTRAADQFGASVAIDDRWAVVGSPGANRGAGAAYVFDVVTGRQQTSLLAPDGAAGDEFGFSVDISGNRVVVGARRDDGPGEDAGSAYVYDAATGSLLSTLVNHPATAGDEFGFDVGISGNMAIVGARFDDHAGIDAGSATRFDAIVPEPNGMMLFIAGLLATLLPRYSITRPPRLQKGL